MLVSVLSIEEIVGFPHQLLLTRPSALSLKLLTERARSHWINYITVKLLDSLNSLSVPKTVLSNSVISNLDQFVICESLLV